MSENNDDIDRDDLYGDVDLVQLPPHQSIDREVAGNRPDKLPKSLTDRVEELESLTEKLQRENKTLKRNIGTLYRTAVAELQRKDRTIKELREGEKGEDYHVAQRG